MKQKTLLEWVIIILILLFFAIPLPSRVMHEPVPRWPIASTHSVYQFLFK